MNASLRRIWGLISMLKINNLVAGYEGSVILRDINIHVPEGKVVSVLGSNGAGKTTLMRAITGVIKPMEGTITFCGESIENLPAHETLKKGLALVPEGRQIFDRLTVYENLMAGAYSRSDKEAVKKDVERMYEMFPILAERKTQKAGTFSGGQQQMLAIARGLMSAPKLLILDEPSLGLAPSVVADVIEAVAKLRDEGLTIILVEQNVQDALQIADYAYIIENGTIGLSGTAEEMLGSDAIRKAYLGM